MNYFNRFLNNFEFFFKRIVIASVALFLVPFVFVGYIFGFFNFNIEKRYDDSEE